MGGAYPEYEFFIDWDNDGGLRTSDFEVSYEGWTTEGTTPADLALSTAQSYSGDSSLLVSWNAYTPFIFNDTDAGFNEGKFGVPGFENLANVFTFNDADKGFDEGAFGWVATNGDVIEPYLTYTLEGLIVGKLYQLSLWTYVPTGGQHVTVSVAGETLTTSTLNEWVELVLTFVAPEVDPIVRVDYSGTLTEDAVTYLDYVFITGQFENVTTWVREGAAFSYGRDSDRALSPVNPAETSLLIGDVDGRWSPRNPHSVVAGLVAPGREVLVRAKYSDRAYDLFRGFLDDVSLDPGTGERSATFEVVDAMAFLGETPVSTEVHQGIRTGHAIGVILDDVGWPAHKRDLDEGATVVQYFWEEGTDATTAINKLVASEGMPSYVTISPSGNFVFRDRHHRLLDDSATTSVATIMGSEIEPMFSPPMEINLGWKDIINSVEFTTTQFRPNPLAGPFGERVGAGEDSADDLPTRPGIKPIVWSFLDVFSISAGETRTFDVIAENPFIMADVPTDDHVNLNAPYNDYQVISGVVSVSLSRTSGQTLAIQVSAVGGAAMVKGMQLRAIPLVSADSVQVLVDDQSSITKLGKRISHSMDAPWANANDMLGIAQVILGHRANKLPTVNITLNNGTHERMMQILERDLSDRITIIEPRTYTNTDFYIEGIDHDISTVGKYHQTTFSCEQVPTYTDDTGAATLPFTFNDADAGFNEGVFGYDGLSEPGTVFILDESLLDEGLLSY